MNLPQITCRACNGAGRVKLSEPLFKTFSALRKLGKATILDIHKKTKERVDVTAINNRMRKLVRLKLVRRLNSKKPFLFQVVK